MKARTLFAVVGLITALTLVPGIAQAQWNISGWTRQINSQSGSYVLSNGPNVEQDSPSGTGASSLIDVTYFKSYTAPAGSNPLTVSVTQSESGSVTLSGESCSSNTTTPVAYFSYSTSDPNNAYNKSNSGSYTINAPGVTQNCRMVASGTGASGGGTTSTANATFNP